MMTQREGETDHEFIQRCDVVTVHAYREIEAIRKLVIPFDDIDPDEISLQSQDWQDARDHEPDDEDWY